MEVASWPKPKARSSLTIGQEGMDKGTIIREKLSLQAITEINTAARFTEERDRHPPAFTDVI
jgi:hypothetical protein